MAASDEVRRHVFTAALEQGQQFMEAAAVTGYATRPVLAFYGLSQLGRSIAAASWHLRDTGPASSEAWRPSGHGITPPASGGLHRPAWNQLP
jgi:YaaC-like Protein